MEIESGRNKKKQKKFPCYIIYYIFAEKFLENNKIKQN